jgi:hypothetical protein
MTMKDGASLRRRRDENRVSRWLDGKGDLESGIEAFNNAIRWDGGAKLPCLIREVEGTKECEQRTSTDREKRPTQTRGRGRDMCVG